MHHFDGGVRNAAFTKAVEHFTKLIVQDIDLTTQGIGVGRSFARKHFFQGRAKLWQEVFGTDAGFNHFFQLASGHTHWFGSDTYSRGQAFTQLLAQLLHTDFAFTRDLTQCQEHTVGVISRQMHGRRSMGHTAKDLLCLLVGEVQFFGGWGKATVAFGCAQHFQTQLVWNIAHVVQLLATFFNASKSIVKALAHSLKLLCCS